MISRRICWANYGDTINLREFSEWFGTDRKTASKILTAWGISYSYLAGRCISKNDILDYLARFEAQKEMKRVVYEENMAGYPDVLTHRQVCEILMVSKRYTERRLRSGTIRSLRPGRGYKVPKVWLIDFMLSHEYQWYHYHGRGRHKLSK